MLLTNETNADEIMDEKVINETSKNAFDACLPASNNTQVNLYMNSFFFFFFSTNE